MNARAPGHFSRWLAIASILVFGLPAEAAADSDGYYCTGRNYLVYQFSFSDSIPGHNLFIIDLSDADASPEPMRVPLPDFQVHGLMCGDDSVQVLGWRALYRISFGGGVAELVETVALEPGSTPEGFERQSHNLAALRPYVEVQALAIDHPDATYELRFAIDPPDQDETHGTTDLVCLDGSGRVVWSYRLYQGWIRE